MGSRTRIALLIGALAGLAVFVLAGCGGPEIALTGTVTDAYTGKPVPSATVKLGGSELSTDAGGKFQTSRWSPKDTLEISASGYEPLRIALESQPQLAKPTPPAVSLEAALRPNTLSGVIADSYTAKPLAGATVSAGGVSTTTGPDGRFVLAGVPESFTLTVNATDYQPLSESLARKTTIDLALRPAVLTGLVTDRYTNGPIAGATVQAGDARTTTGPDGRYRLTNVPENATVTISAPGYAELSQPIEKTTEINAVLRPDTLKGTLLDAASGQPIPNATVIATPTEHGTAVAFARIENSADGAFTLEGVPEQGFLQVLAPGYRKAVIALKPGQVPATIKLEPFKVKALYITAAVAAAGPKLVNEYLDLIDKTELNALVVDLKSDLRDDLGLVYYDSQVPIVKELGTARDYIDMKWLISEAKKRNIYLIARVQLFSHDNVLADKKPEWAVKNRETGEVYADYPGPGIRYAYLDPWNRNVWNYNIELGVEAAQMGFDEINYDYIRYSDWYGDLSGYSKKLQFSQPTDPVNNPDAMYDNIAEFMKQAHKAINSAGAYFSVDTFGRTLLKKSMPIGQDLDRMARHADYICPMPYPSLWWAGYLDFDNPAAHPYEVIYETLREGQKFFDGHYAKMRPWLQDHTDPWQGNRVVEYGPAEVRAQIDATEKFGKASGWMLYDSANAYKGAFGGAARPEQ
jgi:hypothetical protein